MLLKRLAEKLYEDTPLLSSTEEKLENLLIKLKLHIPEVSAKLIPPSNVQTGLNLKSIHIPFQGPGYKLGPTPRAKELMIEQEKYEKERKVRLVGTEFPSLTIRINF